MTFEEIEDQLPNGFHDAEIREIRVDFLGRSVTMEMNLLVGGPGDPDPELYLPGTLRVLSLSLFFVEPPDPRYPFVPDGSALNASGCSLTDGGPVPSAQLAALPPGTTAYSFILDDWNSFLYIAGANVEFSWDNGGPESKRGAPGFGL